MGSKTGKHLFQKGICPNPGGKPKPGSARAKKRARLKVQEILEMMDFRPFEEMVKMYQDVNTKTRYKVDILIELCNYIAPKLKNVEVSGDQENPFIININVKPKKELPALIEPVVHEIINDDEDEREF